MEIPKAEEKLSGYNNKCTRKVGLVLKKNSQKITSIGSWKQSRN